MLKNIIVLCIIPLVNTRGMAYGGGWPGRWFPQSPTEKDVNPVVSVKDKPDIFDAKHGILMGVADKNCDDGKTNLQIDWFMDPENYTCYDDKRLYLPKGTTHPIHSVERIPDSYHAQHKCMNESISYAELIPTFGSHRPLWAQYGEYTLLPKQRWLHNLEHGAVAMLYHPCANKNQVSLLRSLVRSCLYKHVITPYNLLTPERPLALVTWGHRLEMSKVAPEVVVEFIRENALKGPEGTNSKNGQYTLMLIEHAEIITSLDDTELCPRAQQKQT